MTPPLSPTAIWIKHGSAKVFNFNPDLSSWRLQEVENSDRVALHDHLAGAVERGNPIVLLGPDLARFHFRNHLIEQHPLTARRLVACEATGADTDQALAAWGRHFMPKL